MGIYLAPCLLKKGYDVFVTTRTKKNNNPNLKYIVGNAHDIDFLKVLFQNKWDVIIDFMVYSTNEFQRKVDILLTDTKHYIYLSSYRVFADSNVPIIESSPKLLDWSKDTEYLETDEYALSKARQERILQNSKYCNWTIIRPSITYSKNRLQLMTLEANSIIYRAILDLPVIVSEEVLKKKTTMTWAGDVAQMIAGVCNNDHAFQEDYNAVTNEAVFWSDVSRIYSEHAKLKICEVSHKCYQDVVGNKYQIQYDRMFDRVMNNSKILNLLNISQEDLKTLESGLALEIDNTMKYTNFFMNTNYVIQGRMDGVLGTHIPLDKANSKDRLKYYWNYLKFKNRG